jgi:hypothetical protein
MGRAVQFGRFVLGLSVFVFGLTVFALGLAMLLGTGEGNTVGPPRAAVPVPTPGPAPGPDIEAGSSSKVVLAPPTQPTISAESGADAAPGSPVAMTRWRIGHDPAHARDQAFKADVAGGGPLYLWMTLNGTEAAIEPMRAEGGLRIEVRWVREDGQAPGAPNLVTPLTIGRPGLADIFERQVKREGSFEWRSWARKDSLSPGTWTVSLTYPDGRPLLCGVAAQPCRFTVNVG